MGTTSARGGRPIRPRWLLLTVMVWAALFGAAYAVGSGLPARSTTTTTTTTRAVPVNPGLAPGSTATSPGHAPQPPPVRVKPIVPMPPAPALKPYRLPVVERDEPAAVVRPVVYRPPAVAAQPAVSSTSIGTGSGGM
jgi:hypothetical protein